MTNETLSFDLAAFDSTGRLVPGFGTGGETSPALAAGHQSIFALVPQPDDHFVAAGYAEAGGVQQFALARFEGVTNPGPAVPSNDNVAYLGGLYRELLGRAPDDGGRLGFLPGLEAARLGALAGVATNFILSGEGRGLTVRADYQSILGRTPAPAEVAAWLPGLQAAPPELLLAALAGSDEAFRRAGSTNAGWLDAAYRDPLGRPARGDGDEPPHRPGERQYAGSGRGRDRRQRRIPNALRAADVPAVLQPRGRDRRHRPLAAAAGPAVRRRAAGPE
jgi:hypothetical protein